MRFSRRFRALGRITAFFGATWGIIGTALDMLLGGAAILPSLLHFGVIFGTAGALSGILTGLVLARGESGRSVADLPTWRSMVWGFLAGFGPAAVMLGILSALGGAPGIVVPLLGLGAVSGGATAGVALLVSREAKQAALESPSSEPEALAP